MGDDITIGVTEITNLIEVTSQPNDQIIDIGVTDNTDNVTINVTPSVIEINIIKGDGVSATVSSVNGYVGDVVLTKTDLGLSNVDNTSDLNKPISTATQSALDLKVPYIGAISNVNLGEFQLLSGQITFDQTPTQTAGVGVLRWNDTDGTLDLGLKGGNVTLQLGQEQIVRVVNKTGSNLTEAGYQAVYTSGAQGQRLKVDLALANSDLTSAGTLGLITENILINQEGFVTTNGLVRGINTTGSLQSETWADGDILYLSPITAGKLTNIKPTAPQHSVTIGVCVYAHITQGSIFVKVDNGYELEELHNVLINTAINNDALIYESATGLWKNKTISSALGYTPENVANKSDSYTVSSSTTYASTKALVDGLATKANDANVVHKTGDEAMSGSLESSKNFIVNRNPVNFGGLMIQTSGISRWYTYADNTNESGFNAGSNYKINRFDDAGLFLGIPLEINRATGVTSLTSLSLTDGTNTYSNSLGTIAGNTGQPFYQSNKGYYLFKPSVSTIVPRFYIMPNGTATGTASKFEMFTTDYVSDGENYSGLNIITNATNNDIQIGSNRLGTGSRLKMVLGGDYVGSVLQSTSSRIELFTDNSIGLNSSGGEVTFGENTTDPFSFSIANQYTFKNPTTNQATRVNIVGNGTSSGVLAYGTGSIRNANTSVISGTSDYVISLNKNNTGTVVTDYAKIFGATGNLVLKDGAVITDDGVNRLQVNGSVKSTQYRLSALNTAPATATSTGTLGEIRVTATHIYVCTATNIWVRTALATW